MKGRFLGQSLGEWAVIALVILALLGGWMLKVSAEEQTFLYTWKDASFRLPSGWRIVPTESDGVRCQELASSLGGSRLEVQTKTLDSAGSIVPVVATVAGSLSLDHARQFTAYQSQEQREILFQGQSAILLAYTFVEEDSNALNPRLPIVMRGQDLLTQQGGHLWIFSVQGDASRSAQDERRFQTLLDSFRLEEASS